MIAPAAHACEKGAELLILHTRSRCVIRGVSHAMLFEWDAEKNRTNQTKHSGLDFETASRVFADPELILRKDRVIDGEQRWHAIGRVREAIIVGRACLLGGTAKWRRSNPYHLGPRSQFA